jgi:hypothetical protein
VVRVNYAGDEKSWDIIASAQNFLLGGLDCGEIFLTLERTTLGQKC